MWRSPVEKETLNRRGVFTFEFWKRQRGGIKEANVFSKWCEQVWHCHLVKYFKVKNIISAWKRTDQPKTKQNTYPCEVHSNSGGFLWMVWDGLLWWRRCSDPGSAGQESTQPASVLSLLSSRASWFGISFWMPALTSELVSQPCASVSGLQRDTERERESSRKKRRTCWLCPF